MKIYNLTLLLFILFFVLACEPTNESYSATNNSVVLPQKPISEIRFTVIGDEEFRDHFNVNIQYGSQRLPLSISITPKSHVVEVHEIFYNITVNGNYIGIACITRGGAQACNPIRYFHSFTVRQSGETKFNEEISNLHRWDWGPQYQLNVTANITVRNYKID